ncbi:MAG: hypothetical protein P8J37_08255 [Fuerstiella sp.]|nr:hypothetical protein [Fuerstiella sp.]
MIVACDSRRVYGVAGRAAGISWTHDRIGCLSSSFLYYRRDVGRLSAGFLVKHVCGLRQPGV